MKIEILNPDFDFTELLGEPNYDFEFGEGASVYNTLKGVSNNFNSIWCDSNSGLDKGKFYISTNDSVMVVNLTSNSVEDYYTNSVAGRSEDTLKSDDIIDITIAR